MCKLNPRVDFAFKKLFGSEENKDILIAFINSVVSEEDQVKSVELKNPYNIKKFSGDKASILDIKATDETGRQYNIEMQISDQSHYDKRVLYYWSRLYSEQLEHGVSFGNLKKTVSINVLNFNCFNEKKDYHNVFRLFNVKSKKEYPSQHMEFHFIELEKFDIDLKHMKTALDRWTQFLRRAEEYEKNKIPKELAKDPAVKKAIEVLDTLYLDKEEREIYEGRLKWLRDEAEIISESREEAKGEGLIEGEEIGLKKGKKEIAKTLKNRGMSIEEIIEITGLSQENIKNL